MAVRAARHHLDFLNNSRNDLPILGTEAQTHSSPDDTGNRLRICPAGSLFTGCRDESLPGVPVIDARLADMRAVSGVSEAGAGVDAGNATDAAPAGVDAPADAAGDAVVTAPDAAPGPDAAASETAAPADGAGVDAADATTAGPASLRRGLVLWLPLDDGPGNLRARDDSGHMNSTACASWMRQAPGRRAALTGR